MKKKFIFIFIILVCTITIIHAEPLTTALHNLTQSLRTLQTMLTTKRFSNYQEFETAVNNAYTANNPALLDQFEQTLAVRTAKYLITTVHTLLAKGHMASSPDVPTERYIPLMAHITQLLQKQYPNTKQIINCVSLAAGGLQNEFLLVLALRFAGYKKIRLIPIDTAYTPQEKEIKTFVTWCNQSHIPTITTRAKDIKDGVIIESFNNTYAYINLVESKKLPKNHILLEIQASNYLSVFPIVHNADQNQATLTRLEIFVESQSSTPNYLRIDFTNKTNIALSMPYLFSDVSIQGNEKQHIVRIIQRALEVSPYKDMPGLYQESVLLYILQSLKLLSPAELIPTFNAIVIGSDVRMFFYDLIKHTALQQSNIIAFESSYAQVTHHATLPETFAAYMQSGIKLN